MRVDIDIAPLLNTEPLLERRRAEEAKTFPEEFFASTL
jgi:hypothetical protein